MLRKFNLKIVSGFALISIIMTAYIALMGLSANRASAVIIHDFSQEVADNWYTIATNLDIPLENTKPGMLSPVIADNFSAIDLVIYGHELVSANFQSDYKQLDMPRMVDKLYISVDDNNTIYYNVGGVQLLSIQSSKDGGASIFYIDVPTQLINTASQLYDGVAIQGDQDGEGVVRYDKLDDGRYIMGLFLPYSQLAGA